MGSLPTVWTPEREHDLKRLAATQLSAAAIGERMGMSPASITTQMCRLGLRTNLTLLQRERIVELFVDEGWTSLRRISMRVGLDTLIVTRVLAEAGLIPFMDPADIVLSAPPLHAAADLTVRQPTAPTAKEVAIVKAGIQEGLTQRAIAERHPEMTRHRVHKVVRQLELTPKRVQATRGTLHRQQVELRQLLDGGMSQVAAARQLGVSQAGVSALLRESAETGRAA